ncbi:MAG: glycosyltransferase [Phycisphaerae bacterium]|nr:glycosyltransferase [Phycisphaerae bacterium]
MRIAIVDPYFIKGLGYQTTGWFDALVAQGHHVRVFCSCYVGNVVRHLYDHRQPFVQGLTEVDGGEVLRLPGRQLPRDIVECPGLAREVLAFSPETTLAIYPGTMFARDLIAHRDMIPGSLFSTFGENRCQRDVTETGIRPKAKRTLLDAAFFLLKRPHYQRVMEASDVVLMQTPDTLDFLLPRVARGKRLARLSAKCALFFLGFDKAAFHVDSEARSAERRRLAINDDDVVALYACKITAVKRLGLWVSLMAAVMRRVPKLRTVLIGIRNGDPESARVLSSIEATGLKDRFICLPFASREQLPRLANAADFGVWHLHPAVTIQEVMGTGLYMVLTNDATVSHLVADPETGRYFHKGDYTHAEDLVVDTANLFIEGHPVGSPETRLRRAEMNAARFSYKVLAEKLVAAAHDLPNAMSHLHFTDERAPGMGDNI